MSVVEFLPSIYKALDSNIQHTKGKTKKKKRSFALLFEKGGWYGDFILFVSHFFLG